MAQGDFLLFDEYTGELMSGTHNLASGGDTFKLALITNAGGAPLVTQTTPTWGDFSANEVTGGTSYTAAGDAIASQTVSQVSGGQYKYDSGVASITWSQDASGPTDIAWGIVYNETDATGPDKAVGFIDMTTGGGTPSVSLQAGDVTVTWNASGIHTVG